MEESLRGAATIVAGLGQFRRTGETSLHESPSMLVVGTVWGDA
jgi:hypothetical protein